MNQHLELEPLKMELAYFQKTLELYTRMELLDGRKPSEYPSVIFYKEKLATVKAKIASFSTSSTPKATESLAKQGTSVRWLNRNTGPLEKQKTSSPSTMPKEPPWMKVGNW